MIIITIPATFAPERSYALEVLMGDILNLDYRIKVTEKENYHFILANGKKLLFKDHFFSSLKEDEGYLKEIHIPSQVVFAKNSFILGKDIPLLFGSDTLEEDKSTITCGIDIVATVFFMLSRWEEYVNPVRDSHQRFPSTASLAYKFNFLDRPIVNEYAEMVWQMLLHLGCSQERQITPFHFNLSHDVDGLLKWHGWPHVLRTVAGDILKRRQPQLASRRLKEFYAISSGRINDPFDTYDRLMDRSESLGLSSHFYFMTGGSTDYDRRSPYKINGPRAQAILQNIERRGHVIGFHPSYDSCTDEEIWASELRKLQDNCSQPIQTGRQHYLRFQVPYTWQLWQNRSMKTDSTCGYADREGFRCGTGNCFPVFNILTREKLDLREQPLIFMDSRNFFCGGFNGEPLQHKMAAIVATAKKFNSPVTLLFHNNYDHEGLAPLYENILALA
jgi:Family of unknown function (DUF7033)